MSVVGEPAAATRVEVASQPQMWRKAAATSPDDLARLPQTGETVLVLGCGTSYYVGDAYARRRRGAGLGQTRAEIPSQLDDVGDDEVVLLVSRSGTTGDLVAVAKELGPTHRSVAIVGAAGTPLADMVPGAVMLEYADEKSVMQTRFATTALSLLRHTLGDDVEAIARDGERALQGELAVSGEAFDDLQHLVFLGDRWSAALAQEAALKVREAAGMWTEAYPLSEYPHGPISCAGPTSLIWTFCELPAWLASDIERTGARIERGSLDPQAELVRVHRLAVELALREGRDPDAPPYLNRSVLVTEV